MKEGERMSEKLIEEARELCEKATPAPWRWEVIKAGKCIRLENDRDVVMGFERYGMSCAAPTFNVDGIMERADVLAKSILGKEHHVGFDDYIDHPDAAFIEKSRSLIPELCDALEKAEEQLAESQRREAAAIAQIRRTCQNCKYWRPKEAKICIAPYGAPCGLSRREAWKWRGAQEDER